MDGYQVERGVWESWRQPSGWVVFYGFRKWGVFMECKAKCKGNAGQLSMTLARFSLLQSCVNAMSGLVWFHLLKISAWLCLDDGYRRSGVSSWGGECPNPRETYTIQCSKCLLYIIYHQCLLQLYNINVHYPTVCHCAPKQQWQYTNCSKTVFIFPFLHDWICECLIFIFWNVCRCNADSLRLGWCHMHGWKFSCFLD